MKDSHMHNNLLVKAICSQMLGAAQSKASSLACGERYGWGADNLPLLRALMTDTVGGGGTLIPIDLDTQTVVNGLTAATVIRRHVPKENFIFMPHGNMDFGRVDAPASAGIIGEGVAQKSPTLPGFGQIQMSAKKIWASVPISNSALRFGAPDLESIIASQLLISYGVAEDSAFISGAGGYSPKDLILSAATNTAATSNPIADLQGSLAALEGASVPMRAPLWITTPDIKETLQTLTATGSGNFLFNELNTHGTILGIKLSATTAVPAGTVILVDAGELLVGTAFIETRMMSAAMYLDSDGVARSSFDRDQTVLRLVVGSDLIAKHAEAIAVLHGVTSWT
jgi:HK97 family phage major capsid protein